MSGSAEEDTRQLYYPITPEKTKRSFAQASQQSRTTPRPLRRAVMWLTYVNLNGGVLSNCFLTGPKHGGTSNRCLSVRENSSQNSRSAENP